MQSTETCPWKSVTAKVKGCNKVFLDSFQEPKITEKEKQGKQSEICQWALGDPASASNPQLSDVQNGAEGSVKLPSHSQTIMGTAAQQSG